MGKIVVLNLANLEKALYQIINLKVGIGLIKNVPAITHSVIT